MLTAKAKYGLACTSHDGPSLPIACARTTGKPCDDCKDQNNCQVRASMGIALREQTDQAR
jgi:hypothetical protein